MSNDETLAISAFAAAGDNFINACALLIEFVAAFLYVESDVNVDMKDIDIVTTQSPTIETENLVNTEHSMLEDTNNVEEQNLSFVEEINKGEVIVEEDETKIEEKPKKIENKPKRKSYSEMFGSTWCGYGYTTD